MEEPNKIKPESKWNKYPTIEEQKEHFKNFSLLPMAIAIIIGVLGLIGGIAGAVSSKNAGVFFGFFIGSVVVALITFAILRILISSQVLTVLYLEKISKQIEGMKDGKESIPTHTEPMLVEGDKITINEDNGGE